MINLIFSAFALFLISCNNGETKTVEVSKTVDTTETMVPTAKPDLPYKFSYERTAVMGNPENVPYIGKFIPIIISILDSEMIFSPIRN